MKNVRIKKYSGIKRHKGIKRYKGIKRHGGIKRYSRRSLTGLVLLSLLLFTLTACTSPKEATISDTRFVIGTIVSISLFGTDDQSIMDGAFDIIDQVDHMMSLNIEGSELSKLNAGKGPIKVSDQLFKVIEKSIDYSKLSNGDFDVTLEPVISLWGIGSDEAAVPSDQELAEALSHVGYQQIVMNKQDMTIQLPEGVGIDLGAIGKGYAADLVASYLKEQGIKKAILDLGGNVLVLGEKAENTDFKVGLQDPFKSRNEYFGIVDVSNKTVVTSGIYERNFVEDGVSYHHILSTEDGYPVNNGLAAVTIIAKTSIDADALSTVLFLEGIEKGLEIANNNPEIECIFITEKKELYLSQGAGDIFKLVDDTYQVMN